jgi:hypothetical protein
VDSPTRVKAKPGELENKINLFKEVQVVFARFSV